MSDYISEKIEQYERKLKQAEKAGKHNKAKKYQEKLERLRAEAAEQDTDSDTDSDDDDIDSDDEADNSFALDEEPDVAPASSCVYMVFVVSLKQSTETQKGHTQETGTQPSRGTSRGTGFELIVPLRSGPGTGSRSTMTRSTRQPNIAPRPSQS